MIHLYHYTVLFLRRLQYSCMGILPQSILLYSVGLANQLQDDDGGFVLELYHLSVVPVPCLTEKMIIGSSPSLCQRKRQFVYVFLFFLFFFPKELK